MVAVMMASSAVPVLMLAWATALIVLAAGLGGFIAWGLEVKRRIAVTVIAVVIIAILITGTKVFADGVDIPGWLICWPWC